MQLTGATTGRSREVWSCSSCVTDTAGHALLHIFVKMKCLRSCLHRSNWDEAALIKQISAKEAEISGLTRFLPEKWSWPTEYFGEEPARTSDWRARWTIYNVEDENGCVPQAKETENDDENHAVEDESEEDLHLRSKSKRTEKA